MNLNLVPRSCSKLEIVPVYSVLDEEQAGNAIARAAAIEEAARTGKAATPNWFMTFDEVCLYTCICMSWFQLY